jgi:uncharacterized protein YkwD
VAHLALIGGLTSFGISSTNIAFAETSDQATTAQAPAISASQILSLTNQTRTAAGLGALTYSAKLTRSAQLKAQDMADKSYFAHENPQGQRLAYCYLCGSALRGYQIPDYSSYR